MSVRIKANKNGDILLPHEKFHGLNPEADYEVVQEGSTIRLVQVEKNAASNAERLQDEARRYWAETSPEERAKDFLAWMDQSTPPVPHLPDEALRRENIYD